MLKDVYIYFVMSHPVSIPTISKCVKMFGDKGGNKLHTILQKFQFRNEGSYHDQLVFLISECHALTVREITKLLGISNNRYYKCICDEQAWPPKNFSHLQDNF